MFLALLSLSLNLIDLIFYQIIFISTKNFNSFKIFSLILYYKLLQLAMKRQEEKRNCENRSEDEEDEYEMSEENEEEEDGPLAELRRRAPDVTITVVKPGQKTPNQRIPKHQVSLNFVDIVL